MKSIFFVVVGLIFNAVLSVVYRIYSYYKFHNTDKLADLIGQSIMGIVLFIFAYFVLKNHTRLRCYFKIREKHGSAN